MDELSNTQYKIDKKKELELRKTKLDERLVRMKFSKRVVIAASLIVWVGTIMYYLYSKNLLILACGVLTGITYSSLPFVTSTSEIDAQILQIQNEIDLLDIGDTSIEMRAEKLFKYHQIELKKYYDQTLQHTSWIFVIGLFCILSGFVIVGVTLYLIYNIRTTELNEKILLGSVGTISTLMANFIGAIYLRMYSETVKSLTEFHNRLVVTHHLHFGNYMIAKISDQELREKTLSELTLKIADYKSAK